MSAPDRRPESASEGSGIDGAPAGDGSPAADRPSETLHPPATDGPPEVAVRGDEPAARCPYCGLPFRRERLETLHRGLEHPDAITDRERAAFERAYREEEADVRRFRLLLLGAVILCYFGFLLVYAVVV